MASFSDGIEAEGSGAEVSRILPGMGSGVLSFIKPRKYEEAKSEEVGSF